MTPIDWIALDWGTSNLRAWAMSKTGEILDHRNSDQGMAQLEPHQFEPALRALIEGWDSAEIIACGMIGAKQGWCEAPYRMTPCAPLDATLIKAPATDLNVQIISGLAQKNPSDVMRGEETQIAGYLLENPDFDGILCLPGTHTKWVQISAKEVVSFTTYMSGELFALLSDHSTLRHSIDHEGWDEDAFQTALSDAISKPQYLASRLFSIRAETLLNNLPAETARARLSGALIGIELAAARPYWLGQNITIIGDGNVSNLYATALKEQGLSPTIKPVEAMTLKGLTAAKEAL